MKLSVRQLLIAATVAGCLFTPTFSAFAQETTTPPAPAAETTDKSTPPPATEVEQPASDATPVENPVPPEATDSELRRLDTETPAPSSSEPAKKEKKPSKPGKRSEGVRVTRGGHNPDDRVRFFDDLTVPKNQTVRGDAVAIMGDVRIEGTVNGNVAGVFGGVTINGTVDGGVGSVFGDIRLGSKSRVNGDVIAYGPGEIYRHPDAFVGGKVEVRQVNEENIHMPAAAAAWWNHALRLGRPLAVGAHLGWLWILTVLTLGFYALLALVFPAAIRRCGDTLVHRPGQTILSALLGIISIPVLLVLLIITFVGILLIPFVPITLIVFVLFGKAAICALIGRAISQDRLHPALAVLVGGVVLVLFNLIPVAGMMVSTLAGFLGFGCVICTMLTSPRPPERFIPPSLEAASATIRPPVPPAPMASAAMVHEPTISAPPQSPGFGAFGATAAGVTVPLASNVASSPVAGSESPGAPQVLSAAPGMAAPPPAPPPSPSLAGVSPASAVPVVSQPAAPPFSAVGLPRVGFWLRLGALLIDFFLVGIICAPSGVPELIPVVLASYAASMWKTKGTTVGGIICNLRVVRLDDRPLDWATAIVRALGCFLSFALGGLGFVWVVFDDEKQSWHDKIAGTTVVRTPKTVSLI
jgi:uncharacterized RDD family membrane protein YckC